MNSIAERFEHEGVPVEIHYDDDGDAANPRQHDNVTTLVCWHPDYVLGDFQLKDANGRGSVDTPFEIPGVPSSMNVLARYLSLAHKARCVSPLYLYDHSGITISVGAPNPFTFDAQGWDTSMVGFAYCTDERITELCGDGEHFHTDDWITEAIKTDVAEYDLYLRGAVYGYVVAPGTDDEDSCWGYLGDESVKDEARHAAAYVAAQRAERLRVQRLYLFAPETMVTA